MMRHLATAALLAWLSGCTAAGTADTAQCSELRDPLLQHEYTLAWPLRNAAIGTITPTPSTRHLYRLLTGAKANATLRIAVVGTSFSLNHDSSETLSWVTQVVQELEASLPNINITLVNGAVRSSKPYHSAVCLDTLLLGQQFDLVFVEYSGSTANMLHHPIDGPEATLNCKHFEMLLRKILLMPNHPQVVLVETMLPKHLWGSDQYFASHSEDERNMLASYYFMPMISMRNALWHLQDADVPGYAAGDVQTDEAYMAELVLYFLERLVQTVAEEECVGDDFDPSAFITGPGYGRPYDPLEVAAIMDAPHLLTPLNHDLDMPDTWVCAPFIDVHPLVPEATGLRDIKVKMEEGWEKRMHGEPGVQYSYESKDKGAEGSSLWLTWTPSVQHWNQLGHGGRKIVFIFAHLVTDWASMGVVDISCKDGCECTPTHANATHTSKHLLSHPSAVEVRGIDAFEPKCTVGVTVAKGHKGGTKFQIRSLFVLEAGSKFIDTSVWRSKVL